jgi:hypothetical protein
VRGRKRPPSQPVPPYVALFAQLAAALAGQINFSLIILLLIKGRIYSSGNILPLIKRNIKPPISPPIHFRFAIVTVISTPNLFRFACRRAATTSFRFILR